MDKQLKVKMCVGGTRLQDNDTSGYQIVIGTPGRIWQLHEIKMLDLTAFKRVFIRDYGRAIGVGYDSDFNQIFEKINKNSQISICSPNFKDFTNLSTLFKDPLVVYDKKQKSFVNDHFFVSVENDEKRIHSLVDVLNQYNKKTFVYFENKNRKNFFEKKLGNFQNKNFDFISFNDLSSVFKFQSEKGVNFSQVVLTDFLPPSSNYLEVSFVIHFDLPHLNDYRSRLYHSCISLVFVFPHQLKTLKKYEKLEKIKFKELPFDFNKN